MTAQDFRAAIDWSQPWLAPFRAVAASLLAATDWRAEASVAASALDIRNHRELPIRFVSQETLPPDIAYEAFISTTGQVPSRDNLHDFFNALMWLHFPRTKVRLNAIQAAEIARNGGVVGVRGKIRDAVTIFDENAAIVAHRDPGFAAELRAHDWDGIFTRNRTGFGRDWGVLLFGHALLEKLVKPYKAATAHAWTVCADAQFFACTDEEKRRWMDDVVSNSMADCFTNTMLTPLPVAGVPGWWKGQDAGFYADASVFRPRREKRGG